MFKLSDKKGFSMFELLIVIAFMAIMGAVGIGYYFTYYRQTILNSGADQIKAFLYSTQQKSIGQQDGSIWGVHFENSTTSGPFYASFKGLTYSSAVAVDTRYLDSSLTFDYPASGASFDIIFSKINGRPNDGLYKKIYLQLKGNGSERAIRVSPVGIISLDNGEITWWKLDDASGTAVVDSTIFRGDGVFVGAPVWQATTNCKRGACLSFTAGNYVNIPTTTVANMTTGDFTVALWAKSSVYTGGGGLIAKGVYWTGAPGYTITEISNPQCVYFNTTDGGASNSYISSGVCNTFEWTHFVGVRRSANIEFWANGVKKGTVAAPAGSLSNSQSLTIGKGPSAGFNGLIDDVRIYDRALSDAEIANLYQTTK